MRIWMIPTAVLAACSWGGAGMAVEIPEDFKTSQERRERIYRWRQEARQGHNFLIGGRVGLDFREEPAEHPREDIGIYGGRVGMTLGYRTHFAARFGYRFTSDFCLEHLAEVYSDS